MAVDVGRSFGQKLPIQTARLVIERFTSHRITNRYISWLNDPRVVEFSEQRLVEHTRASCMEYMSRFDNVSHRFLAVLTAEGNTVHIGNMTVHLDVHNGVAELEMFELMAVS